MTWLSANYTRRSSSAAAWCAWPGELRCCWSYRGAWLVDYAVDALHLPVGSGWNSAAASRQRRHSPGDLGSSPTLVLVPAAETVGATSFLLHEEHATRFREEYPECVGARLLAAGGKRGSGAKARRLVVVAAPLGAIQGGKRKKGAGAERFENERCVLSEDGWSYLRARGGHCNLLVWSLDFHCAGIDTFLCVADTNILSEPARGSCIGSISPGETVLASGARQVPSKGSWVRIGLGWVAISTTIGDVTTVHLEAAGCERQCGGVCECASTCTGQTKSRHGCDFRLQFDRTLEQVPQRLVRVTVIGKHSSSKWAPLPLDNRAVSPRTRQVILKKMTNKDTARKVQLNLNTEALVSGATTNEDGVVTDHSVVPSKKVSALSNVSINAYSESFC